MSTFETRLDSFPTGWRPAVGDTLIGTVTEVSTRESEFGGAYPLVVVATEDGDEVAIHGFHAVLKNELARLRPKEGDKMGVKYHGKDDKGGYERYRVIIERAEPDEWSAPDWDRMTEPVIEPDPTSNKSWAKPSDESADAAL